MKKTKKILSILLACMMLMSLLSVGTFAAVGDQDNPINANDKWFGHGADAFLLNTTLTAGDTDGVWYELTADAAGLLHLEHSYKNVDYQITAWVNGMVYSVYENGTYYRPIATYPVAVGDVITIQVIAQDTSLGGTVYLNAKFIDGSNDLNQMVKVKAAPAKLYVAAGATVFFQDDSLNAVYATQYVTLAGDSVEGVTLYTAAANATGVVTTQKAFTDTDGDNIIETKLGGSQGSAGAPAVKPAWAIENNSNEDRCFMLNVVTEAHECIYDDNADAACNSCGAIREIAPSVPEVGAADILSFGGNAISEDVNGLAFKFDAQVAGVAIEGYRADYTNATVTIEGVQYNLLGMGAVLNNQEIANCTLEDVDGKQVLNLFANKAFAEENDTISFSVRIKDIPNTCKDTPITARPYFIYECDGETVTVYDEEIAISYHGANV